MVFKDNQTLTSLYEGITKQATPSEDQLVKSSPILSKTDLSKDQDLILEAYKVMSNKGAKDVDCKHAAKGCDCSGCDECKDNQEKLEEAKKAGKPDYLDVDEDGNKKEPMKKALKDKHKKKPMKEGISSFKELFNAVISEKNTKVSFSPEPINPHLESDRKKLEKLRAKRKKEKESDSSKKK